MHTGEVLRSVVMFVNNSAIQRVVTHGTFELDGGSWEVDNNIWLVGDDSEVIVIDAAHDAKAIEDAVAGRHVVAVVCTHGHNDHITVAPQLGADLDAPVLLNPADTMLWETTHGDKAFRELADGQVLTAGGVELRAIATPGHSPVPPASTLPPSARSSPATRCSMAARGRRTVLLGLPHHPRVDQDKLGLLPPDTVVYRPRRARRSAANW